MTLGEHLKLPKKIACTKQPNACQYDNCIHTTTMKTGVVDLLYRLVRVIKLLLQAHVRDHNKGSWSAKLVPTVAET